MKSRLFILLLFIIATRFSYGKNIYQSFDKAAFYAVLKSEKPDEINNELSKIENASFREKQAYEGTLLMRKAGLLKKPKDKLHLFKEGATKLETAIANDNDNAEYRFLRLIIQEHAPGILKYNKRINDDSAFIKTHFKSLQPAVQQAVVDYAKSSKTLHPQDFE